MGKTDMLPQRSDHTAGAEDNDNLTPLSLELFGVRALEGLTAIGEEQDLLWDLWKAFWDGNKEESIVKVVEELQKGNTKSVQSTEWSKLDSLLHFWGKVYVPPDPEIQHWLCSSTTTPK